MDADWTYADLGFDTGVKLWFIDFYNAAGVIIHRLFSIEVVIGGGSAKQVEWRDQATGNFYHVRERIYPRSLISLVTEASSNPLKAPGRIVITYTPESKEVNAKIPDEYAYLCYAYDVKGSARGFVEFYDDSGDMLASHGDRWIIVNGVKRRTLYRPEAEKDLIRIMVRKEDIGYVAIAEDVILISGKRDNENVGSNTTPVRPAGSDKIY